MMLVSIYSISGEDWIGNSGSGDSGSRGRGSFNEDGAQRCTKNS